MNLPVVGTRRLILIRHCEATGQQPDAALTASGIEQAERLKGFLADQPVDRVVSSAFVRARQTAQPLALSKGLDVNVDARLNERILSATLLDNWRDLLRNSFADPDGRGPGGESAREALERAWAALTELLKSRRELPAVVTHGNLMSLVLNSIDESFGYEGWANLTNPDVYMVEIADQGAWRFRRMWR